MIDHQLATLAQRVLQHSLDIKPGERIMIRGPVLAKPFIMALIKLANQMKAIPFAQIRDEEINRCFMEGAHDERLEITHDWDMHMYQSIDADIWIDTEENDAELSLIDSAIMQKRSRIRRPWVELVTTQKKWVILNWPTKAQAQKVRMPFEQFYDFVISASSVDYIAMKQNMLPLSQLMSNTDRVRITGPGTDLRFSIKGIPNVICAGENNLPDGEIYTAPVRDSVEGRLTYNTPSPYHGKVYNGVRLEFEKGRIVNSDAENDTEQLKAIFDTDEGARYIGEFAIGVNPMVTRPFGNTLFDEKITGSFHFTPGNAYENEADNGNRSSIHWDMVCIQTAELGGGEIWFDDVLVRKDGLFVLPELKALNPAD